MLIVIYPRGHQFRSEVFERERAVMFTLEATMYKTPPMIAYAETGFGAKYEPCAVTTTLRSCGGSYGGEAKP